MDIKTLVRNFNIGLKSSHPTDNQIRCLHHEKKDKINIVENNIKLLISDGNRITYIKPTDIMKMIGYIPKMDAYDLSPHIQGDAEKIKENIVRNVRIHFGYDLGQDYYSHNFSYINHELVSIVRFSVISEMFSCKFITDYAIYTKNQCVIIFCRQCDINRRSLFFSYKIKIDDTTTHLNIKYQDKEFLIVDKNITFDMFGKFQFNINSTYIDLYGRNIINFDSVQLNTDFSDIFPFFSEYVLMDGFYYKISSREPSKYEKYYYCWGIDNHIKTFITVSTVYCTQSLDYLPSTYHSIIIGDNIIGYKCDT